MSVPLIKRNFKQMIKPLLIFVAVLCMYQGVIIYMFDPKLMDMLNDYQKALPQMMAAVGMTGATNTLIEFVNTYLYGFLMQLFPFIFILIIGNNFLMKYVDTGSMAVLLASPNSRMKIILTQAVSLIVSVVIIMTILTLTGIGFSEGLFPGELDIPVFIELNASALLMQLAVAGIIFFAASVFNESKYFYAIGCGLPLCFFLCSMSGNMGDKLEKFKYVSIYTLFPAKKIVESSGGVAGCHVALACIVLVLFAVGIAVFRKKDLSI